MNLDKLKGKLVERKKTYADCAESLGISITAFSNKMNGKSRFYVEEINTLSDFLQITQSEKVEIFLSEYLHCTQEEGEARCNHEI